MCEMKDISQEIYWMHMEENLLGSPDSGSGGMGTDDTTFNERVEASFVWCSG